MTEELDELDVLEPQGQGVMYRGERLEIRPLTIGALPQVVRAARPVIKALLALDKVVVEVGTGDTGDEIVEVLLDLIEQHSGPVYTTVAIAMGREAEWIAGGELPEFLVLAQALFEVNRDFFGRLLAPLLGGRAGMRGIGAGLTPSSSSSSVDTA